MSSLFPLPGRSTEWHGYLSTDCQWLLAAAYHDLRNEAVDSKLNRDFMQGQAQIRMRMTGVNTETDVPDIIYACKYKPDRDTIFMIRIEPATGQVMDIQETAARWPGPLLGVPNDLSDIFSGVFDHFAAWHAQTYGVGPVAPPADPADPASIAMLDAWAQARHDRIAQGTIQAPNPQRPNPRI